MLSVLIPIYNFNVTKLVQTLHNQATNLGIVFEIILVDDYSKTHKIANKTLSKLPYVQYIELSENYGRSKIRNYLVLLSKYENLIFLDCDSLINNNNFIKNYIENIKYSVISGGRTYTQKPPEDKNYYLHWLYGTKTESIPLDKRLESPYKNFQTNNFFVKKSVFKIIKFNENITKYGHEDTLFGYELKKNNFIITHIDNSVIHIGLEEKSIFIKKTFLSINNLVELYNSNTYSKDFFNEIKLLKYFFILKKYYLCLLLKMIDKLFNKVIINNLYSKKPFLFLLNLLKLNTICKMKITIKN